MRKLLVVVIALLAISSGMVIGQACGDKTMRLGRGLRFLQMEAKRNPSTILIHTRAVPAGKASRLQEFLKTVGHQANTFDNVDQVSETLKGAHYDVLLTNVTDARELQNKVSSLSPNTVVVPVTFKSDEAAAATQYKFTVKSPKYAEDFLPTVNQIMKSRSKKS
jgi:hypothetical protein